MVIITMTKDIIGQAIIIITTIITRNTKGIRVNTVVVRSTTMGNATEVPFEEVVAPRPDGAGILFRRTRKKRRSKDTSTV